MSAGTVNITRVSLLRWLLILASSALLATACSWSPEREQNPLGKTLADLQPARLPDTAATVPAVSFEEIEASYRRALDIADSEAVRRKIRVRLAGLAMMRSEQQQLSATDAGRYFHDPIAMYRELIDLYEGWPGRDKLLYQLAKAYALDGRGEESARVLNQLAREYPDSPHLAEAQFRRAERAFSEGDYAAAEEHYGAVVASGSASPFAGNALYMQGWAQFKRGRYQDSLATFTRVLDDLVRDYSTLDAVTGPQQNLLDDTLRVMSLAFSYLDGAKTIQQTYERLGWRQYNHLLYQRLGELYLAKKRYRDSADTFAHFIEQYPDSDHAPAFAVRIIAVYDQGDFPSQLLPAKERFVQDYGVGSPYWRQKPVVIREYLGRHLQAYLQELAGYSHARAQAAMASAATAKTKSQANSHFEQAAHWYRQYVESFPNDANTPEMLFLLGEACYESGRLAESVTAYERVAYEFARSAWSASGKGADAGYAAILAINQLQASAPDAERPRWARQRTESSLTFADYYPDDPRAAGVLARAAQSLLADGEHHQAIAAAQRLIQWVPPVEPPLQKTAWLIIGQGQFDLGQYAEAEDAYRQVLSLMSAALASRAPKAQESDTASSGPDRQQVVQRIAASMYKQAEQRLAAGDKTAAVGQLLAVSDFAPKTAIAVSAHYDAATWLMELEQWPQAASQLQAFRRQYPNHELTTTLPAKLVVVYQAMENWRAAADELRTLAATDADPEVRRQSLILAAELYEKSGDATAAILAYRDYANTYTAPFHETLEAANKLAALYGEAGKDGKRRFWLNRIIRLDATAGEQRSDRSRYLAAKAASELAENLYQRFVSLPLNLPLKESLARKRKAMEATLTAYQQILDYGVSDFATQASYRLGDVYVQLSRALMESERPDNLTALELEQYEILLEEQAFPFEERAIHILETNARRSWGGVYDDWVKESFERLEKLLPARYQKQEEVADYSHAIH